MFEQAFKNIEDILHKDAGCSRELGYVEQISWVLFLNCLDDLKKDRPTKAKLAGKPHTDIIDEAYKWGSWAVSKVKDGRSDHYKVLMGDNLVDSAKSV